MRKDFGPQTWLFPMPVLIIATYDENNRPDAMNAAWGGMHDTNQIGICIAPSHQTAKNLQLKQAFTVSVADVAHLAECDYLGLVSGKTEPEKLSKVQFHTVKSAHVDAPIIEELPMTLECKLLSYDAVTGCAVGEIVNVSAAEKVLDAAGKIDPAKLQAITFDPVHHEYLTLGAAAGQAFAAGAKFK